MFWSFFFLDIRWANSFSRRIWKSRSFIVNSREAIGEEIRQLPRESEASARPFENRCGALLSFDAPWGSRSIFDFRCFFAGAAAGTWDRPVVRAVSLPEYLPSLSWTSLRASRRTLTSEKSRKSRRFLDNPVFSKEKRESKSLERRKLSSSYRRTFARLRFDALFQSSFRRAFLNRSLPQNLKYHFFGSLMRMIYIFIYLFYQRENWCTIIIIIHRS